jgi:DNA polymerase-3 subunit beta
MKLTLKKEILLNLLKNHSLFSPKKAYNDEFLSINFSVEKGLLTTKTKYVAKMTLRTEIEYDGSPFSFSVNVFKLLEAVKCADKGSSIELSIDGKKLFMNDGLVNTSFDLITKFQDYTPKKQENQVSIKMNVVELLQAIKQTKATIYADEKRYNINGLNFDFIDDSLKIISIDGHRLSKFEAQCLSIEVFGEKKSFTVPKKDILNIEKLLKQVDCKVNITFTDIGFTFSFGECEVFGKLIDAEYSNWRRIVEHSGFVRYAKVNRAEILKVAESFQKRAKDFKGVGCIFEIRNSELCLKIHEEELKANVNITVETECENFDCKIFINYLCENLNSCEGEYVLFEFTKTNNPIHIFSPQNNKFKVITMPMT